MARKRTRLLRCRRVMAKLRSTQLLMEAVERAFARTTQPFIQTLRAFARLDN